MHARLVGNLTEPAELYKPKKRIKNAELSFANSAANYPKHSFKKTTHITLSSAAAFKLQLCGNFCAAKPQSCDLKAVQGAKRLMLQRLVIKTVTTFRTHNPK